MSSPSLKKRMAERLLRLALDAALTLPPPSKGSRRSEALFESVRDVLPRERDATLRRGRETAEEREGRARVVAREASDPHRRGRSTFDPWAELFAVRRVITRPWDRVWTETPLVLHDGGLLHALDFPPYQEAAPHDVTECIAKIINYHPGPVESLRMDSSILPAPDELSRWMKLVADKGGFIDEMVMLDVLEPHAEYEFPASSLRSPDLKVLALGFMTVSLGHCYGFSGLETLPLVCCRCSARDLSLAVQNLGHLKKLGLFGVNLAVAGAGAGCADDGVLGIDSCSLSSLEMRESKATGLTLRYASNLEILVAGVVSPGVLNPRVVNMSNTTPPPVRIEVVHAEALESLLSLVLWKQRVILPGNLCHVQTMEVTIRMGVSDDWGKLLDLASELPLLCSLTLTREDECRPNEELQLQRELDRQPPRLFWDSLHHLALRDYRAGGAEVTLVSNVLATAPQLVCISLYPHDSVAEPEFVHYRFLGFPRLSNDARVQPCQSFYWLPRIF